MNEAKRKYAKACKVKTITFYKKDADLLAFANKINFQAFVKEALCNAMLYEQCKDEERELKGL